jgi:hypothetical protein
MAGFIGSSVTLALPLTKINSDGHLKSLGDDHLEFGAQTKNGFGVDL